MEIDDTAIFGFMQEIKLGVGRLEEGQKNLTEHIKAVSGKADSIRLDLTNHKDSSEAHGLGMVHKSETAYVSWASVIISLISVLVVVFLRAGKASP